MAFRAPPRDSIRSMMLESLALEGVGRRLHRVAASERIDGVRHPGLEGDDLLGAQGQPGRVLGGQGQGLVACVGVQALAAPQHRGQGLERHPDHVVVRLLGGERDPAGLDVEPALLGPGVGDSETLLHEPRPQTSRAAELRHLLDEVRVTGEEEGEPLPEVVRVEPRRARRPHVLEAVGEGEGDLLGSRRPGLTDVVAGDRDRVPPRYALGAVGEDVGDEAERGLRGKDPGAAGHVLLEDVVLHRARQRLLGYPATTGHRDVERQQDGRGGVDRHRGRDPLEGDAVEQGLHVLEAVDGDADPAHLAERLRVVGVVADLGGQVEGHGEPGGALLEEVAVASVRLGGGAEARRTGASSRAGPGSRSRAGRG